MNSDHDLSQSQMLNRLSHPGAPMNKLKKKNSNGRVTKGATTLDWVVKEKTLQGDGISAEI